MSATFEDRLHLFEISIAALEMELEEMERQRNILIDSHRQEFEKFF